MGKEAWLKLSVFTTTLLSILVVSALAFSGRQNLVQSRNFYGTVKVNDQGDAKERQRRLSHGIILHGFQYLDADKRRWPTSYYTAAGGAGRAVLAGRGAARQRVGVVGLGTGTMAAYCRPGDDYRFYEINPQVVSLAASAFTFLSDCPAQKQIVLGDARLSLEREAANNFDVLVLDAFSGDSVPVHLLTREAFGLYFRHLKRGGLLAVHISNQNLDLGPVVKLAAEHYGKHARLVHSPDDQQRGARAADWVVIGEGPEVFQDKEFKDVARELAPGKKIRPWTDDYSSIYAILK